jgi:hypothetical protein
MAIAWADVVLIAPELSAVVAGAQTAILADVVLQLDEDTCGTRYDLISKYLAAHLGTITLRGASGAAGPVTSEKVGPLARSYAAPYSDSTDLESTPYGQEYLRLINTLAGVRIAVVA